MKTNVLTLLLAGGLGHMRPERPEHLHPDAMHPALREKGRVLPSRTIDRQAKVKTVFLPFFGTDIVENVFGKAR